MLGKIFNKQDIAEQLSDKGFSIRHDLSHKFNLKRKKSDEGFDVYVLENASRNERVVIKRILFDRLRAALQNISTAEKLEKPERINFAGKDYFLIYTPKDAMKDDIVIEQMDPPKLSTRYLRLSHGSLRTLMKLMYDERLKHPNDALSEIIEYHKLFHFSFVEAGESITSDLILRKDVLSHTEEFVPSRSRDFLSTEREGGNGKEADEISGSKRNLKQEDKDKQAMFRSRLAERNAEKDYVIDYSQLFAVEDPNEQVIEEEVEKASQKKRKFRRGQGYIQLPMHTKDIKELAKLPFQCELSPEEMEDLRSLLTNSDHNQFFLGFEIIDAVYRSYGKLRTFRFPLYYMKVELLESGRNILLVPEDGGAFYINHLALANLVESFSSVSSAIENSETFFKTLLNQQIQWGDQITRMHLRRNLPIAADIFNQTRDILLGLPGENGKGGLLGNLKIVGAECDLDSVLLFEAQKKSIPTSVTLETDLDTISKIAEDEPRRFYDSLLGRFLSPEMQSLGKGKILPFCDRVLFPGAVPKATKNLLSKLNEHDLLLLEGPPGTGKTFTIMNLFIHCVNTGKKMLIVSDKPGAIHALTEKVEEYLLGKERASAYAKMLTKLMYTAIKVVDALPQDNGQLGPWCDELRRMLALDNADSNTSQAPKTEDYVAKIVAIDKHMTQVKSRIQALFEKKIDAAAPLDERVAPKYLHATTLKDIDSIIGFVDLLGIGAKHALQHAKSNHNHPAYLTRRFMQDRHFLIKNYPELYNFYSIDADNLPAHYRKLDETRNLLQEIAKRKPKSIVSFLKIARTFKGHPILEFLLQKWAAKFPQKSHPVVKFFRFISCFIYHPLISHVKRLQKVMYNDLHLLQFRSQTAPGVWREFQMIHELLMESTSNLKTDIPLSYEIVALINEKQKKSTPGSDSQAEASSLQAHLQTLLHLQNDRDQLIKDQFLASLRKVVHQAFSSDAKGSTSLATSINAKLNELKTLTHIDQGMHLLEEIREKLIKAFPFWVCRKQSVSFLFPTEERIFDLVIVDEATQCRVDDALPLLFRAKKLLVVGDEKQTVLQKNSYLDDYLFKQFCLDELLRSSQARGIKGGGSHIFSLVKSIKQASVMLDEHFRCPPEIIEFSNRYVYNNELKTMQWQMRGALPAVIVDHSETRARSNVRLESGKYKGLETEMVDRFMTFVGDKIIEIEKQTGKPINLETDVALCYFLLKNEPYVKSIKNDFLLRMKRGGDILDGAGAALQGKEREYIFYLWDVSRSNMGAFKQGDEEDKRRGELNVLMSRPKVRAYHYLHKEFAKLDHRKTSITDYLWKKLQTQGEKQQIATGAFVPRTARPGTQFRPWGRTSGQLMGALLNHMLQKTMGFKLSDNQMQFSVTVGDPTYRVDLMLIQTKVSSIKKKLKAVALIDLATFKGDKNVSHEITDYYFQLQRAVPNIRPVFLFIHEILDMHSYSYKALMRALSEEGFLKKAEDSSNAA